MNLKLYVEFHLDNGNMIYHISAKMCAFSTNITSSNIMEKLESVQNSAALLVTRPWRGTSQGELCTELGWESLNLRTWNRRLT